MLISRREVRVPGEIVLRCDAGQCPGLLLAYATHHLQALGPSLAPSSGNGVFNPACFIHTDFDTSSPTLDGKNFIQAFTDWCA